MAEQLTPEQQKEIEDQKRRDELGPVGASLGDFAGNEQLGVQPIERLLGNLIISGDLSVRQATDVINLISEDTDLKKAAGLIAGEFNIGARKVAEASEGDLDAKDVEETKRSFLRTAGDVGGTAADIAQAWLGTLWVKPSQIAGEAIQDVTGFRGFGTGQSVWDEESGIAGAIFDTEAETREKVARAELRDELRGVIDILNSKGYVSDGQATRMKSVTDNYNVGTYQDLITELTEELEGFEYSSEAEMRFINETMHSLKGRVPTISGGDIGQGEDTAEPTDAEEVDAGIDVSSISSLEELLSQAGVLNATMEMPETPGKATLSYVNVDGETIGISPVGPGPEGLFDPLYVSDENGAVMTNSQYEAIMASDALKKRYAEIGKAQGYSARVTELLNMDTWKPRSQGGRGLPISNLDGTIPTAVVREDWQRPLYNWDMGSGFAQWRGMAGYTRRANVDYMVNNGLIREDERGIYDDPFSIAGAQMWEQVNGLSRDGQMSQHRAMRELGEQATLIRSAMYAGRGSSGRIAPTYSVPASLRAIPDYKALATETRSLFRNQLGRDLEDNELAFLSDELGEQYKTRNDQLIQIHKAAWDDGLAGGTVDVEDFEVTDPASALQFDIEDRYSDELERQEDVEEYGESRQLMIDSIAVGQRMI